MMDVNGLVKVSDREREKEKRQVYLRALTKALKFGIFYFKNYV